MCQNNVGNISERKDSTMFSVNWQILNDRFISYMFYIVWLAVSPCEREGGSGLPNPPSLSHGATTSHTYMQHLICFVL